MPFTINNDDEMMFIYQSLKLGNGTHAQGDKEAKRCTNKKMHGMGMVLEIRAHAELSERKLV